MRLVDCRGCSHRQKLFSTVVVSVFTSARSVAWTKVLTVLSTVTVNHTALRLVFFSHAPLMVGVAMCRCCEVETARTMVQ